MNGLDFIMATCREEILFIFNDKVLLERYFVRGEETLGLSWDFCLRGVI